MQYRFSSSGVAAAVNIEHLSSISLQGLLEEKWFHIHYTLWEIWNVPEELGLTRFGMNVLRHTSASVLRPVYVTNKIAFQYTCVIQRHEKLSNQNINIFFAGDPVDKKKGLVYISQKCNLFTDFFPTMFCRLLRKKEAGEESKGRKE